MSSPQPNPSPEPLDDNNATTNAIESLDGLEDSIEPQTDSPTRRIASRIAFVFHICTIMAYIFLSSQAPSQDRDLNPFKIARLVVVGMWMINGGVLFICHARYLIRHKREIASAFFVSMLGLNYLVVGAGASGMTDFMGVIMVSIVIAALCPGALGSLFGMTGPP